MVKVKKKYGEGASKIYITRGRAIKKLQISIADFRRLCIFKGIYPREPANRKKANRGKTTPNIFYYTKDIQYLMHEPILNKFREDKIFARKLSRALVRGEVDDAKRLDANRPRYKLDGLIKERYPTFVDALRDLDDPLSMLFLFAIMPATDKISFRVTQTANRLCHEWMAFVAREKLLRKVFVSIKGVYYQAVVKGQEVLWLVPFDFPQNIPNGIDFQVMLSFLEFYTTLVQFVLYRLYTEAGLVYPPKVDEAKLKGVAGLSAFILQSREQEGAKSLGSLTTTGQDDEEDEEQQQSEEKEEEVEEEEDDEDEDEEKETSTKSKKSTPKLSSEEIAKIAKDDAEADEEMEDVQSSNGKKKNNEEEEDDENVENIKLDSFQTISATETNAGDVLAQPSSDGTTAAGAIGNLFSGLVVFVGREVPSKIVEFLILSCGGKVILESSMDEAIANEDVNSSSSNGSSSKNKKNSSSSSPSLPDLSKVTHQICDRPTISHKVPGRVYVQPQWIFDSINRATLLPVGEYAPGEKLPPHLSPWGDREGYDPNAELTEGEEEEDSEEEEEGEGDSDDDEEKEEDEEDDDEEAEEDEEAREQREELKKESLGVSYSESNNNNKNKKNKKSSKNTSNATTTTTTSNNNNKNKKRSKETMELEEQKALKLGMMTNKQKKMYDELQGDVDKKSSRTEQLKKKKRKIESKLKKNNKK